MRRLKKGKYLLRNLRTNLWDGNDFYTVSIHESFFYKSLIENNRTIYDEYRELVKLHIQGESKTKKVMLLHLKTFIRSTKIFVITDLNQNHAYD